MKISVITICFNSASYIERNLKSVNSQHYSNLEQIFVDNLSTDLTLDLIRSHSKRPHHIISEKDKGISDAFNKGIRAASGEIIAILNSDDEFYENSSLSRVANTFESYPDVEFVFGDMLFIDPEYGTNIRRPLLCPITHSMPYNHPAFFVKKSFYEKLGLFDETFRYAMDFELISRMYKTPTEVTLKGKQILGSPLAIMHAGGASWKFELNALDDTAKALKKNGLWSDVAEAQINKRRLRTQLKYKLNTLKLNWLVKVWRFFKWKSHASS